MLNRSILQGRLTRDPELRQTQSGVAVASFTVAWSEKYKDTETKCFLPCTAWRGTGELVSKYFTKGQEIIVEGKLQTRSYEDKQGNNRTVIEMTCDAAHFCGTKASNAEQKAELPPVYETSKTDDFAEIEDDGDLPF